METTIRDYSVKKIKFEEFEKSFFESLKPGVSNNVIFYKFLKEGLEISFGFDNFIVTTYKSYSEIKQKFPNSENDSDVVLDDTSDILHPSVKKFILFYTHNRGIEEM